MSCSGAMKLAVFAAGERKNKFLTPDMPHQCGMHGINDPLQGAEG
jgi:hypothetical protein